MTHRSETCAAANGSVRLPLRWLCLAAALTLSAVAVDAAPRWTPKQNLHAGTWKPHGSYARGYRLPTPRVARPWKPLRPGSVLPHAAAATSLVFPEPQIPLHTAIEHLRLHDDDASHPHSGAALSAAGIAAMPGGVDEKERCEAQAPDGQDCRDSTRQP